MPLEGNRFLKHAWPLAGVLIAFGALAYGDLSQKLTSLSDAQKQDAAAVAEPSPAALPSQRRPVVRPVAAHPVPEDPRWKRMDSRLSEQSEKLASTQEQMAETREELQGRLGTTKDELVTSIARTQ